MRYTWLALPLLALGCSMMPAVSPAPAAGPSYSSLTFAPVSLDALDRLARNSMPPLLTPASDDPADWIAPHLAHGQSGAVNASASYSLDALAGRPEWTQTVLGVAVRRMFGGMEEAWLPGFAGSYPELKRTTLDPLTGGWAADARLVRANVSPQELAGQSPPPSPICAITAYGPPWDLVYVSDARQEALRLWVDAQRTRVLRATWSSPAPMIAPPAPGTSGPQQLAAAVGREAAIQKLLAALRAPEAIGEEERTRWDYFFNRPYAEPSYAPREDAGPVYDVPDDLAWDASLQTILGHTIWVLRADRTAPPAPASPPTAPYRVLCTTAPGAPRVVEQPGVAGLVDAQTGTVIRFVRPSRVTVYTP